MQFSEELERTIRQLKADIAQLQGRTDEHPVRYPAPTGGGGGGGGRWGVVRGWNVATRPELNVTMLQGAAKSGSITEITPGTTTVVGVSLGHGILVGDSIAISGVDGMTEINGENGSVSAVSGTSFTVDIDSSGFSAYAGGGTWTLPTIKEWSLPANTTEQIATEPAINADQYEVFKWVGAGSETYPLLLPTGVIPVIVMTMSAVRTALHYASIYTGNSDIVPAGMPVTEGLIVNGAGEVSFAN